MPKATVGLLLLFAFSVPWEHSLDLGSRLGDVARLVGLLMMLSGVPALMRAGAIRKPTPMQWLVLALFIYFAASYFWTIDPDVSSEKLRAYFQVMATVWIVLLFAGTPWELKNLLLAFVAGCWVLAFLTFKDYSSAEAIAQQIRFAAQGQDPNDVARLLDLGLPIASLLFLINRSIGARLFALGYLPVGTTAVVLTASRGGFSGSVVALAGSTVILAAGRRKVVLAALLGMVAAGGVAWFLVPSESLDRLMTIPEQVGSGDLNDRFGIWVAGWHAFVQAPWFGYGAGTYATASHLAAEDTAHNTLMAVLVTGGLIGLAIFSAVLAAVAWAVFRTKGLLRVALSTVLAVWIITAMVGSVEENRTTWLLFAIIGLAARLSAEHPRSMESLFSSRQSDLPVSLLTEESLSCL